MSWRTNAVPAQTLDARLAAIERRLFALEQARGLALPHGGDWHTTLFDALGDTTKSHYGEAVTPVMGGMMTGEKRGPARPAGFIADVIVPFCWSLGTGIITGATTSVIADAASGDWWLWLKLGFGVGMTAMWAWRMIDHSRLLWLKETVRREDINGDGYIGKPPPETQRVEIEVSQVNDKGHITGMKLIDSVGIPYDVLIEFLTAIADGAPLTGPSWEGTSGKISQPKFAALMRALERGGLVENKRGNTGRILTAAGKVTLHCLVEPNPLPRQRGTVKTMVDGA